MRRKRCCVVDVNDRMLSSAEENSGTEFELRGIHGETNKRNGI